MLANVNMKRLPRSKDQTIDNTNKSYQDTPDILKDPAKITSIKAKFGSR
jgi:hypothetical protein